MSIREELLEIVGPGNCFDDVAVLETYSKDFSLVPAGMPNYVVKPAGSEEVSQIITLANEKLIPVVPVSSGVHFNGAAIPRQGGIILDLSRMNKVLEVDGLNRRVRIEAGVTWEQLTRELDKEGFRMIMPLLPHPQRSVVTDYLEREIPTNTVYDYGEPLQGMEVVWPTGEIFRTGSASVTGYPDSPSKGGNPAGPGIDFYRFLQGAQGTMGVVTWANLKIEYQPKMDKVLFAPVSNLPNAIEFLYRVLKQRVGQECLILNNIDLAAIIAGDEPGDIERLRAVLPPWTLIMVISGMQRRPEEKIQYEEEFLGNVLRNEYTEILLTDSLPGVPGAGKKMLPLLREPWAAAAYWKDRYRGACQSLFFITRPVLAPWFIDRMAEVAGGYDYPASDIGVYLQPIEHNRACHLEFNLFYEPDSDMEMIKGLYHEAARVLLDEGAFFTRPYGELAAMVYERAGGYTAALKRVKKVFDPNNIMNPGNLCF
jgi:FAD/FMN-containing dehydrogenase